MKFSSLNKEIQTEVVAKSNMSKGFLIYEEMCKYLVIYEEAVCHIQYDFATAPFWISLIFQEKFQATAENQ
jgi:hypothetical protein